MISSRFSVAVHALALVDMNGGKLTSDHIACSVRTNPVVIRRIMSMLGKAKLIASRPGVSGIKLMRPVAEITLLDVYRAVEPPEERLLFAVHRDTNGACPVGRHIQSALAAPLRGAQDGMEQALAATTLEQVVAEIRGRCC